MIFKKMLTDKGTKIFLHLGIIPSSSRVSLVNARLALSSETLTLIELDLDRQLLLEYRRTARHSLDSILEKFFLFAQDFSLLEYRWFFL